MQLYRPGWIADVAIPAADLSSSGCFKIDAHPATQRRGNIHQSVQREARNPAPQQIVDARLRHAALARRRLFPHGGRKDYPLKEAGKQIDVADQPNR